MGLVKNKIHFINIVIPSGAPIFIMPLLVLIEIFSVLVRPLSLAIRLFANMLAGHVLLFILSNAFINFYFIDMWILPTLFPAIIIVSVAVLEIFIAFLQAYIFTLLAAMYLGDFLNIKH